MKSKNNQNNNVHANKTPLTKRRLKTKPVLTLLAILLLGNLFWFILWLLPSSKHSDVGGNEPVAAIDGEEITRQEWMAAMEVRYGKETLQTLVNEAVMEKAATKYKINVTDQEIDLEIALIRSAQDKSDTSIQQLDQQALRKKVRAQLILEKVLTKDILIEEDEVNSYYEENQSLYHIPTTYRTSIIVVASKKEAQETIGELENGSDFSVLARERSLDHTSASLGGDIGFVTDSQTNIDAAIPKSVKGLEEDEMSEPFALNDGRYGIAFVKEVNKGKSFTYEEVEEHIQRALALEQLPTSVTPEAFWAEFKATWFYGE